MKLARIPIKNVIMDLEKAYLDKQLTKGWVLSKKGLFFYQFTRRSALDKVYSIDLHTKDRSQTFVEYGGKELLIKRIF